MADLTTPPLDGISELARVSLDKLAAANDGYGAALGAVVQAEKDLKQASGGLHSAREEAGVALANSWLQRKLIRFGAAEMQELVQTIGDTLYYPRFKLDDHLANLRMVDQFALEAFGKHWRFFYPDQPELDEKTATARLFDGYIRVALKEAGCKRIVSGFRDEPPTFKQFQARRKRWDADLCNGMRSVLVTPPVFKNLLGAERIKPNGEYWAGHSGCDYSFRCRDIDKALEQAVFCSDLGFHARKAA